ncbi:MAG TPA: twin-arginine translocase subunit TatC [Bryobacteraceae bacterium]|nr:twin-arginine translocase subunit TatC [Bryobacteraceae bacterium]
MPDDFEEHDALGAEVVHSNNRPRNGDLSEEAPAPSEPHYVQSNESPVETDPIYGSASDPYGYPSEPDVPAVSVEPNVISAESNGTVARQPDSSSVASAPLAQRSVTAPPASPPPPPPPPPEDEDEEDDEEKGMLRMSFMGHLEELRSRILYALFGVVIAFLVSFIFTNQLWNFVKAPAVGALKHLGVNPPNLVAITPMEQFSVIWVKLPLLVSIFLGSPWILYQVWAFISPGLYHREKRWAVPFITCTAGLFIAGGCFAYFVAFRYGLEFLLGIGHDLNVTPMVSIDEYFDLFVNVTLGVGLVFEMPVLIFFLTLLRLVSPRFLVRNSRYAVLVIVVIAAVVTPTPDIFNMMIFAVPMVLLFFVGVFASYLLVLKREGKSFPWRIVVWALLGVLVLAAAFVAVLIYHYHFHAVPKWPYLVR